MGVRYAVREKPSEEIVRALEGFDVLTAELLVARGITTRPEANRFFARDYVLHDPFLFNDMERAVARILQAIADGERIVIYSDYDCDGIPGGVLMHDFFRAIGYSNFSNYIPHRHEEGYGLNKAAIDRIKEEGATLIITVDCGITDNDEVAHAQERGIDVIVTDHHEPMEVLPPGYAVINPKRKDNTYPFAGLCGSGVAWKLIEALIARGNFTLAPGSEKWLLDVVGIATVADMVPLIDENRILAHYGLVVMRKGRRLGLRHLMRTMRMNAATLTEDDIGFMIGPRINAASRMDSPEDAFKLLTASDDQEAGAFARHLDRVNNERKGIVGSMVKDAKKRLLERAQDCVITIGDPSWRPALVGLAANTLAEEYARPVFLWGRDGRGVLKGSCRSGGDVSVVTLMQHAADAFLEYGGHHASGGFAVKEDHIHTLPQMLNNAYEALPHREGEVAPTYLDAVLSLDVVDEKLVRILNTFAPFGIGNHKPLFLFPQVTPHSVEAFGREGGHLKAKFQSVNRTIEAIAFFKSQDAFGDVLAAGKPADIIAHVEESAFGGRKIVRLRLIDALPAGSVYTGR